MVQYKYSIQTGNDCAKAVGRALPISTKTSIEVCFMIRGKQVDRAIDLLEEVKQMKIPVPYKRAFKDIGHRKGNMTSGRFPHKAAGFIQSIIQSARANAEDKGLNTEDLAIFHISAQQGGASMRGGRRRRTAKRTHVEVILREDKNVVKKKKVAKKKTAVKPQAPKTEPREVAPAEKQEAPAKSEVPVTSKVEEKTPEQKTTPEVKPEQPRVEVKPEPTTEVKTETPKPEEKPKIESKPTEQKEEPKEEAK